MRAGVQEHRLLNVIPPTAKGRQLTNVTLTLVATNPLLARKATAVDRTPLSEFLAAELALGISIEKACYPPVALFEQL